MGYFLQKLSKRSTIRVANSSVHNRAPMMPSRKIPMQSQRVTGQIAAQKHKGAAVFESSLERDLIEILEFDSSVLSFVTQPKPIYYCDDNGKKRRYTPDVMIRWAGDVNNALGDTWYCEVKYRDDLRKNWHELKPKFQEAISYCRKNWMRFKILTEVEIRTPLLENIHFLKRYRQADISDYRAIELLTILEELREATPDILITVAAGSDQRARAEMVWLVWALVRAGKIGVDITQPLTPTTPIWRERGEMR